MMRWAIPVSILILGILWQPAEAQETNHEVQFTSPTGDVVNQQVMAVNYTWPDHIPEGMSEQFYLETEATITAMAGDGRYEIRVTGTDQARVWLDGQALIDAWSPGGHRSAFADLEVTTGYQIYTETNRVDGTAYALEWKPPGASNWSLVPARQEATSTWCDVTLQWIAPTMREDGSVFDPDTQASHYTIYQTDCGASEIRFQAEIDPAFRSVTKQQAIPPGDCFNYLITVTDLDGLESTTDETERTCPQISSAPLNPIFVN